MQRRVAFLLFTAGWGANHFATLLVLYRRVLGFSSAELGILFAAYALGLVPGLLLSGRASDRLGRRALALPASALAIVSSALLAFGGYGFGVLLCGRLSYGLAMGCVMSPGSVWVQELSSAELGPRRATLALSAGFGLGPLVSGVLAEYAPWPLIVPYGVHALIMALGLAGAYSVPETALARPKPAQAPNSLSPAGSMRLGVFGRREVIVLLKQLPVAPWAFGFPVVTMAIVPGLLRAHVARPILYSAFVIATTLFSGVLVQPLTTRWGRRADLLGLAAGAIGILVAALAVRSASPALVFAAALLCGVGYGLVMTTGLREVSTRVAASTRGTAVGIYYVLTYLGFALPFVQALAGKNLGDVQALLAIGGAAVVCLLTRTWMHTRIG